MQRKNKKLRLGRETVTPLDLRPVAGGFGSGSVNCTTLISSNCTVTCPSDCPTCFSDFPEYTCHPRY